jgi:RNA polymerase sigma factor for flagellar operon FliA
MSADEKQELWKKYIQDPDPDTRERLLVKYLPLVKYVAGRMMTSLPSSVDYDDLVSAGVIGLIGALERFDPGQGVKFETFVMPRIRGAILDELRALDWAPRSLRSKARKVDRAVQELERNLGRQAEPHEVAQLLEMDFDTYSSLVREITNSSLLSLDCTGAEEGEHVSSMYEVLEDPLSRTPLQDIEQEEVKKLLVQAIEQLPEQEKIVLALYYYEELTLKEIGQVLSITESRVSQIHSKAVRTLRVRLAEEFLA